MKNRYFILVVFITGLHVHIQAMDNNNEVQTTLKHIYHALDSYGLTSSQQNNCMKSYPSLQKAESTSAILLRLTLHNLSTKQAVDLMGGVYNPETIATLLQSTNKKHTKRTRRS